jgi:ferredoxin
MKSHLLSLATAAAVCSPLPANSFVLRRTDDHRRPRFVERARRWSAAAKRTDASAEHEATDTDTIREGHLVQITHEGRTASVLVKPHETILTALERNRSSMSMSSLPFDCQRGNCLTCAGCVKEGSSSIVHGDDGLAPAVGENLRSKGFVLTCSSYVVGVGVKIELGHNDAAWTETYKTQPESGMPDMGNAAAAKALRLAAEKDVPKWTRDTEKTLEKI